MDTHDSEGPGTAPEDATDATGGTRQPAKPAAAWLVAALLVIAVAAALSSVVHTYRTEQRRRPPRAATAASASEPKPRAVGSDKADLKIEVCLGPCFAPVFDGFAECAEAWPDKVRAEFVLYPSPEGQRFVAAHGEDLACIFFNGKNRFTLDQGDSPRQVHFRGPPGEGYQMSDLAAVLRIQMEELYGELPPDFEEKAAAFASLELAAEPEGNK